MTTPRSEVSMLSNRDSGRLDELFKHRGRVERSVAGAQLDVLALYAVRHELDPDVVEARRHRKPWEADPYQITAQPVHETKNFARDGMDGDALLRIGKTDRQFNALCKKSAILGAVLEAVHGDAGQEWVNNTKLKTTTAGAIPLTTLWKGLVSLARQCRTSAHLNLSTEQRVWNFVNFGGKKAEQAVRPALIQAEQLYERACELWNGTAEPKK